MNSFKKFDINLVKMSKEEKKFLHLFFLEYEKQPKLTLFRKDQTYPYTNQENVTFEIQFSHDLQQTEHNGTYHYSYFSPDSVLGTGATAKVYFGKTLIHENDTIKEQDTAIKEQKPLAFDDFKLLCDKRGLLDNLTDSEKNKITKEGYEHYLDHFKENTGVKEKEVMNKIPYISHVGLFGINDSKYICMDKIEGVNLKEFIIENDKDLSIKEHLPTIIQSILKTNLAHHNILKIIINLLTSLSVISKSGIIHNDIKFENIMINQKNLMTTIIDFGLAFSKEQTRGGGGTPYFNAPEQLLTTYTTLPNDNVTEKSDVYSLGILLRILCCDKNLIEKLKSYEGVTELNKDRIEEYYSSTIPNIEFDEEFKIKIDELNIPTYVLAQLLSEMTAGNPKDRPTAEEALKKFITIFVNGKEEIETMYLVNETKKLSKLPKDIINTILEKADFHFVNCFNNKIFDAYKEQENSQKSFKK